jgi:hypothetical protein
VVRARWSRRVSCTAVSRFPTSHCPFAGLPRRRRGPHTTPGTNQGPNSTGKGGHIFHAPGPTAPASNGRTAGRRIRSRSIQTRKRQGTSLESSKKHLPQRAGTTPPLWIRGASVRALLREVPCSRNPCHNACSAWTSLRRVHGTPGRCSPCSGCEMITSGAGGMARDVDASVSSAGCCDITQSSDHITSTLGACSRAGPDGPLDRPLLGAKSPSAGASPPHGPRWTGSLSESVHALDEGREAPTPTMPPPPPLPAAALRLQSWRVTAGPPLPPVAPSLSTALSSQTSST